VSPEPTGELPSLSGELLRDLETLSNGRQRRFVLELFLTNFNASESYRRAYGPHTAKNANVLGPRLLADARVQAIVQRHHKRQEDSLALSVERLDKELARLAYVDVRKAYDAEGRLLPVKDMPEDVARCIAAFEEEALFDMVATGETGPRGGVKKERVQVGVVRKVKWHSKPESIALGLKRVGALTEKHEFVGPANVTVNIGVKRKPKAGGGGPSGQGKP
jgi:phage terminase small subunit